MSSPRGCGMSGKRIWRLAKRVQNYDGVSACTVIIKQFVKLEEWNQEEVKSLV